MSAPDGALAAVVRELEAHASELGWDQPERIYALAATAQLVAQEPELASALGLSAEDEGLTPIEQEALGDGQSLEDVLARIAWPDEVAGVAVVAERLVLPPGADDDPQDAGRPDGAGPARRRRSHSSRARLLWFQRGVQLLQQTRDQVRPGQNEVVRVMRP